MERRPKVRLARLYQKKAASGSVYFVGRMGAARVLLLRAEERADDGGPIWHLVAEEVEDRPQGEWQAEGQGGRSRSSSPRRRASRPAPAASTGHATDAPPSDPLDDIFAAG